MKLQWPRGRYNALPVVGVEVTVIFDLSLFSWLPKSCGWGEILVWWLGFGLHARLRYGIRR